jgi:hypothetical protein
MTRRVLVVLSAVVMPSRAAFAADDVDRACPDGWFCEPPPAERAAPAQQESAPLEPGEGAAAPSAWQDEAAGQAQPPEEANVDEWPVSTRREPGRFALLARGNFPLIEDGESPGAPLMAGVGAGFRYVPLKVLALDATFDSVFGRDYLDATRREFVLSGALVAFLNPGEHVQVYLNTGLFHSWARVEPPELSTRNYRYFGAFLGVGAEYRFARRFAFNAEIAAFIRGRIGGGADSAEFVNRKTGETSNASAGALLRAGIAWYF